MIQTVLTFTFEIGQRVYHKTGGDFGIVTDITWRMSSDIIWYHVTFDINSGEIACREFELQQEKVII